MNQQENLPKFIIVIGTSAGGINALEKLLPQLEPTIDASIFIVNHFSRKGIGNTFVERLKKVSKLPCSLAENEKPFEKGQIYLAPPDYHLLIEPNRMLLGKGAPENRWRPSVNNLFRSAAAHFSSSVIGIILSGMLDDGTIGMVSIKKCGGISIIQDPMEADYPGMPKSVLENVEVDHVVPLERMGELLKDIISTIQPQKTEVPKEVMFEADLDKRVSTHIENLANLEKLDISCPDCGGGLYVTQKDGPAVHYRCHVGHSFTDKELLISVSEELESTFWKSLRMMEERRTLLRRLYHRDLDRGYKLSASMHEKSAQDMDVHIENLKQILFSSTNLDED